MMQALLESELGRFRVDCLRPLDISIPLQPGLRNVNAWYAPPFEAEPVRFGEFVGSVAEGGAVNFLNLRINPHGNGTHTECVGHITKAPFTINQSLKKFYFFSELVSVFPQKLVGGNRVITKEQLQEARRHEGAEALIIRTLPNDEFKLTTNHSGANPPYLDPDAVEWLVRQKVQHLLVDLPSVDPEEDGGRLLAHRAFWQTGGILRENSTISELIYVNNSIKDGLYLLNLQIASFEIDVSPSKPVLYALEPVV